MGKLTGRRVLTSTIALSASPVPSRGAAPSMSSSISRNARLALLKPLIKAYLFGHLSSTAPRLLGALLKLRSSTFTRRDFVTRIKHVISTSIGLDKFPSFCALLAGSYTVLQTLLLPILEHVKICLLQNGINLGRNASHRWSRYIAAFVSAFLTLPLLGSSAPVSHRDSISSTAPTTARISSNPSDGIARETIRPHRMPTGEHPQLQLDLAGKTIDITLLASVRAVETLLYAAWASARSAGTTGLSPATEDLLSAVVDPLVFASSTAVIMWAWFYSPERLPRSYNRWINSAAAVDPRLISALRYARRGEWVYGLDLGKNNILASMARDYNLPPAWGDPAKTIPIRCDIVHMGTGSSCHWHAAVRFARAFRFALAMYLPLQLSVKAASRRTAMNAAVLRATLREAVRSSAFLGAFIALFYYSVCAGRTWLGPKIFGSRTVPPMMWDAGLAVGAGCAACGWSILLERPTRRQELAYFVAPRAAAAILPRRYERKHFWRERLAFSASVSILFTLAQENPRNIRGVLGALLHGVLDTT